ncbi:MAG: hypothetical protein AMXMBFR64_08960 [Myxococcales bacterium]
MMGVGMAEIVVLFGLLGGMLGGPPGELKAPRDGVEQAVKWVLPDAHVAVYVDVEASIGAGFALLDELERLPVLAGAPELGEALREMRRSVESGLADVQRDMGIDARHGIGDVTLSLSFSQAGEPRFLARVRGRFPAGDVIKRVAGEGAATELLHGTTMTTLEDGPSDKLVAGALDETTLVVGPRSTLDELLGGRPFPATEGSAGGRLAKVTSKKTGSFVYLAPPAWLAGEMRQEAELANLARFVDGVDFVVWAATPDRALLRAGTRTDEAARRVELLLRAAAAMLAAFDPLTDALTLGAAAVLPLVTERELGTELHRMVSDEQGMAEFGTWAKKRFGGKGKITRDAKKGTVDLELSNPASLPALALPLLSGMAVLRGGPMSYEEAPLEVAPPVIDEPTDP